MNFIIDASELNKMISRVKGFLLKKTSIPALRRVYIKATNTSDIYVLATDIEQYAIVKSRVFYYGDIVEHGNEEIIGINIDDINGFANLNGEVKILTKFSSEDNGILNVKGDSGRITIPCFKYKDDFTIPELNENATLEFTCSESWLYETLNNLEKFADKKAVNKSLQMLNFNTLDNRVEALDGKMVATRCMNIQDVTIYTEETNPFKTIKINANHISAIKKLLDKKSSKNILVYKSDKYVYIDSIYDFSYIFRTDEIDYFNINNLKVEHEQYFTTNTKQLLNICKKASKTPITFYNKGNVLNAYYSVGNLKNVLNINASQVQMKDGFYITFVSNFLVNIFCLVDSDDVTIKFAREYDIAEVKSDGYDFLVLPMRLSDMHRKEMLDYFTATEVA